MSEFTLKEATEQRRFDGFGNADTSELLELGRALQVTREQRFRKATFWVRVKAFVSGFGLLLKQFKVGLKDLTKQFKSGTLLPPYLLPVGVESRFILDLVQRGDISAQEALNYDLHQELAVKKVTQLYYDRMLSQRDE